MIEVTTFLGLTVAVFGLARSGIISALALKAGGAIVACWDDNEAGRVAAEKAGLPLVDLRSADWSKFAALVLAPGVPLTHPKPHWTVERAQAARVEIIGDVELFFRERARSAPNAPVIAITGTNGKSTTTALTAHVLTELGFDVQMGGNIGVSVLALEPFAKNRIHVVELSSFQIDTTPSLDAPPSPLWTGIPSPRGGGGSATAPSVGALLNVTPDHLDRHGTVEHYTAVKERLIQGSARAAVALDDSITTAAAARIAPQRLYAFAVTDTATAKLFAIGQTLHIRENGTPLHLADLSAIGSLRGTHNVQNALATLTAIRALHDECPGLGVWQPDKFQLALTSFGGLVHRMEQLGRVGRVLFINDSKATNADSTEKALAAFSGDIFWICGGTPKEGGIEPLAPYFPRVTKAYLVGVCAPDFARTLEGKVAYEHCGTLDVAIASAARDASASAAKSPVVLLSPACASYDQYKSFEHRGDHFRTLASALPGFTPTGKS
jgi:UDP-N-acetylmuramoylalanine--D-glutamate ligase